MNCAKSVKMIVLLGCIVVNLVGCGMNDTTASSMSTVVSSQDTSSSSCNSEEKNDLQESIKKDLNEILGVLGVLQNQDIKNLWKLWHIVLAI